MARILLIDDEELVRATLRDILEVDDHQVLEAPDGEVGLRLFEDDAIDVVITDLMMPEKEGMETILELRKRSSEAKIVAISGGGASGNMSFLTIAGKLGADHVLGKPVDADELLEVVRALTSKASDAVS